MTVLSALLWLLLACVLFFVLRWLVATVPGVSPGAKNVAMVVLYVVAFLVVVWLALSVLGISMSRPLP